MRNVLSAVLLSTFAISAPAFARTTHKHVAENKAATAAPAEVKPVDTKSSTPSSDGKAVRPRKAKKSRSTDKAADSKSGEVKSGSGEVKPAESKGAAPAEAPAK